MKFIQWKDVFGSTWIINPHHIVAIRDSSISDKAIVFLSTGDVNVMEIHKEDIPSFIRDWAIAMVHSR